MTPLLRHKERSEGGCYNPRDHCIRTWRSVWGEDESGFFMVTLTWCLPMTARLQRCGDTGLCRTQGHSMKDIRSGSARC
eukprot:761000-Hanusia_phi.AAC.2